MCLMLGLYVCVAQTLQSALATLHHVMSLEDKQSMMKIDMRSAKKELGFLNSVAIEEKAKVVKVEADKIKFSADVATLIDDKEVFSAENVEMKALLDKIKKRIWECAGYYTWKAMSDLMKEFLDGKQDGWTP